MVEIVKRNGEKHKLELDKINTSLEREIEGIPHIDKAKLLKVIEGNVYQGMSTKELREAIILSCISLLEEAPEYDVVASKFLIKKIFKEVTKHSGGTNYDNLYRKSFIDSINGGVERGLLNKGMLSFDLEILAGKIIIDRDHLFRYMGLQTLYERYLLKNGEQRVELPQTFWMRVAMGLALLESDKNGKAIEFYNVMSNLYAVPSTPMLFHSGLVHSQLASCFLNYTGDDLHHIFKVFGDNAQMSKYSGGIGTDWTAVRSTGGLINSINVPSQGIIPFLKIQNDVTVAISRSGKRRGAAAVYLENWHYDVEDFIDLKRNTGDERRRTHDINTALWISDLFMQRVENDEEWTLFSPDETPDLHELYGKAFRERYGFYEKEAAEGRIKLFKKLKAKKLWQKTITTLFETGGPWITWKDPSNIRSPQDHVGVVHNSNLCTEIIENNSVEETAVCTLSSINLSRMVTDNNEVNWELLNSTVRTAVRWLDNSIDNTFFPTKETKTSHQRNRPLGLGQMGWQDMLFKLDIDFESEEALRLADILNESISRSAILASVDLAKERGTYETYPGSKWSKGLLPIDTISILELDRDESIEVNKNKMLDWDAVRKEILESGMRNSLTLAIAPTATISNISGCYPCIEPLYSNVYVKSNRNGEFVVINHYLIKDLRNLDLWTPQVIEKIKINNGSIQGIKEIPLGIRKKYKTCFEVDQKKAIALTAIRSKWIDQSQSHNIFFSGKSGKAISDLYFVAWKAGLKTTYYLRTLGATHTEKATTSQITKDEPQVQTCSIENPDCEACQ